MNTNKTFKRFVVHLIKCQEFPTNNNAVSTVAVSQVNTRKYLVDLMFNMIYSFAVYSRDRM